MKRILHDAMLYAIGLLIGVALGYALVVLGANSATTRELISWLTGMAMGAVLAVLAQMSWGELSR